MPQRYSKNNNDLAFFTYDEKQKLGLDQASFDILKPLIDPLCCHKGHVFFKECILKLAAHTAQQKQEKEEEEEKLMLQKARELDAFDQQNHGAMPQYSDKNHKNDTNGFHGANSVKAISYEEEALRTMKAFWLPSATPEAPAKVEAPSTSTICPERQRKTEVENPLPNLLH
ncbi:E3 ubiquitin-protein ligase CSU1 [Camellia lanceoleosa]|uniref:E3 ubiquitin-protein ligase CSU1 n=1 Tax=Camellia lanceoleosa TaxID=1840588 RepID=A0ACC0GIC2_9ERIC|nr:E3 ubiquitin-protein ligase CSU1 [Camellia lanceoleosa]